MNTQETWEQKERRSHKAMCLAYAKDLVVAYQIDQKDLISYADKLVKWIWQ